MRILIVEDEVNLAMAIAEGLAAESYGEEEAHDGVESLWCGREGQFDAIILDIMLPGMNGYVVCRSLREDARTRDGGGAGLGLALVDAVATARGGSVRVSDADEGGALHRVCADSVGKCGAHRSVPPSVDAMSRRNLRYNIRFMRAIFESADTEARAAGDDQPGAEHLVIASLGFEEGSARRVFERLGADPEDFSDAVAAQHSDVARSIGGEADDSGKGAESPDPPCNLRSHVGSAPSAREVFPKVVEIAKRDGAQLSGAYVLMVAAQDAYGTTVRALTAMGLDPETVVTEAREEVAWTRS